MKTQFKTCGLIVSLSTLVIAAQAQNAAFDNLTVSNLTTLIGGPSSANVSLQVGNDGVGTMLVTPYHGSSGGTVQEGLATGAAFLRYSGAGVVYVDGTSAKLSNDGTRQMFLVNSGGRMEMIDASGTGLHLDGSGHLINDNSFSSDANHFVSDGSGNVATRGLATTVSNTLAAVSVAIPSSPFYWTNTTPRNLAVYVDGLVGSVGYNGGPLFGSVNNAPVTVMLQPGAYVTITNTQFITNTPTVLRWHPF